MSILKIKPYAGGNRDCGEKTMIPTELKKKARYGRIVSSKELIQVPNLDYSPKRGINENPYIFLNNIQERYIKVKGKAEEIDFWEDVLMKFQNGKIDGYDQKNVYEIRGKYIVMCSLGEATLLFWGPELNATEKEAEWLEENSEELILYIEEEPSHCMIFVLGL